MTELTRAEQEALESLRDVPPPVGAEARIQSALHARGAIRRGANAMRYLPRIAAGLAVVSAAFAGGFFTGQGERPMPEPTPTPAAAPAEAAADTRNQYMLFVRESDAVFADGRTSEQLVKEYGAWARDLGMRGALIDGWKLTDDGRMVDPSSGTVRTSDFAVAAGELGGLFIIRANSYDEAVAIAETCPHVRYGGRMEVRAVDL
jgi:hypothetical protein